jgi:hypothetical protein
LRSISGNYFQYNEETVFLREKMLKGIQYIVFFSLRLGTGKLESFYHRLSEREMELNDLIGVEYDWEGMKFSYGLRP